MAQPVNDSHPVSTAAEWQPEIGGLASALSSKDNAEARLISQIARERRRADAANARAERERGRTLEAAARAQVVERRLSTVEASLAWRMSWPFRRVAHAIPSGLYNLLRGGLARERCSKPPCQLSGPHGAVDQGNTLPASPASAAGSNRKPIALLIDDQWPRADRDAGSVEIVNLVSALLKFGFKVEFLVSGLQNVDKAGGAPGRETLTALGVHTACFTTDSDLEADLVQRGGGFALVVLNRVYCGGRFMEAVRRHCTGARVLFNTIDLHHVRLHREAVLLGDHVGQDIARRTRERENWLASEADATLVVSEVEETTLAADVPGQTIVVLPLARLVTPSRRAFRDRSGIGFVGGFAHAPNRDAVGFFLQEVWPILLREEPDLRFDIVGDDLPPSILEDVPGRVRYLGALPEIDSWLAGLRLTVAPLRYGAGVKGKVVSSLAAGVPCVATPVAAEGIGHSPANGILEASTPAGLGEAILRVNRDESLWSELSRAGLDHVERHFSPAAWTSALGEALWLLDAMPLSGSAGSSR